MQVRCSEVALGGGRCSFAGAHYNFGEAQHSFAVADNSVDCSFGLLVVGCNVVWIESYWRPAVDFRNCASHRSCGFGSFAAAPNQENQNAATRHLMVNNFGCRYYSELQRR